MSQLDLEEDINRRAEVFLEDYLQREKGGG